MKEEIYDKKLVIAKFPNLEKQILAGDFKAIKLVDSDGRCIGKIVRFPNLSIFGPSIKLTNHIFSEVFSEYSEEDVYSQPFGIIGLDIVAKCPTKSPMALIP